VSDPVTGPIGLSGVIDHVDGADAIAVVLHGLGGTAERSYCAWAASAARAAGMSALRLNLRGADGSGQDFYHVGLVEDLEAALAHPEVARYPRRYALGFSLGGHIALRHVARAGKGAGLRAVAAVCPPIDLDGCATHIDHPRSWIYRQHLLNGLKRMYAGIAARRSVAAARLREVRAIKTIRRWDDVVVAPRYGFADAADYYRQVGVGPLLGGVEVPSLVVASEWDPMVPARTVRPWLEAASGAVEVRWLARAGHVGFPSDVVVMSEVIEWLNEI
jgi:predicted alpha/beta-fold hydrolase